MNAQQQNRISRKRQGNLWDIGCIIQIKSKKCNKNKIRWRSHAWPKQNSLWIGTGRILIGSEKQKKKRKQVGGKMIRVEGAKCFSLYKFCQSSKSCFCFPLPAHLLDGEQVSWKSKRLDWQCQILWRAIGGANGGGKKRKLIFKQPSNS